MQTFMTKSVFAVALSLLGGFAAGEDVPTPYLARCIAQFEGDTDLAVELCRSKRARAVLAPGNSDCVSSWRLINGRISCNKSDSAAAVTEVGFSRYFSQLVAPVSMGSLADFYADKRAGEDARFQVTARSNGALNLTDDHVEAGSNRVCTFRPRAHQCKAQGVFSGSSRSDYTYTLQLDGLLVEQETARRGACTNTIWFTGGSACTDYAYLPPVKSRSLYLWQ